MKLQIPVCTIIVSALTATLAHATIVSTMNPVADAFVSASNPGNNYGGAGSLSAASAALPNGQFQSLLRFDTAAAKANFDLAFGPNQWFVQEVTLTLTSAAPNNAIFNPSAAGLFTANWMENDSWVEGTGTPGAPTTTGVTFNTLPSIVNPGIFHLGTFNFPGGTSGSNIYTLVLKGGLTNDIFEGGLLSMRLFTGEASYLFNSRNNPTVANRPVLTITAAPEPGSAMLLALAITGFLVRSGRKAKQRRKS